MSITSDNRLVASGTIAFAAAENLTTEKKTSAIENVSFVSPNDKYKIIVKKPTDATAGDMTLYVYDVVSFDNGVTYEDSLLATYVLEQVAGSATIRSMIVEGLFANCSGKMKLGAKFNADSGAITVSYKILRIPG